MSALREVSRVSESVLRVSTPSLGIPPGQISPADTNCLCLLNPMELPSICDFREHRCAGVRVYVCVCVSLSPRVEGSQTVMKLPFVGLLGQHLRHLFSQEMALGSVAVVWWALGGRASSGTDSKAETASVHHAGLPVTLPAADAETKAGHRRVWGHGASS